MHVALFLVGALVVGLVVLSAPPGPVRLVSGPGAETRVAQEYGDLPLSFEPNVGQAPGGYDFVARGQGFGIAIHATGATLSLGTEEGRDLVRMNLLGGSLAAEPRGLESLPGKVNYFIGNDPSKWRSGISTFGRVSYGNVLPGVDLTYYGTNSGTLEYDFVVAPSADPSDIRVAFSGANDVALADGSLVITTDGGAVTQDAPVLYQIIAGRRVAVEGRFSLRGDEVGFDVGSYDHHRPLVIDPVLAYSTYLGGSGDDVGYGIAVNGSGQAYVTGSTTSTNFHALAQPPAAPFQAANGGGGGGGDAFVTMLNAAGSALVYSTYLGGLDEDVAQGIAIDAAGSAYVTGWTFSTDFPTEDPLPSLGTKVGGNDAFVTKLDATGSVLTYSTYLGGQLDDLGKEIAVNGAGEAYVTGWTDSTDFPMEAALQASSGGGSGDAFVSKVDATGSGLLYSTYLGGSADDYGWGIAVNAAGEAYVAGDTFSTDFLASNPPGSPPIQGSSAGSSEVFVTKLDAAGSGPLYSTYLGGSGYDSARGGVAIDGSGAAYVAGFTDSADFPTVPSQLFNGGGNDAFVTKIGATGQTLSYSRFLGGSSSEEAHGIAVDGLHAAYVTGFTYSTDFPLLDPVQAAYGGSQDAFVTKVGANGQALGYSTYLGGAGFDHGRAIAVDGSHAAYVTGETDSPTDFPTTQGAFKGSGSGLNDVFVGKLGAPQSMCMGVPVTIQVTTPNTVTSGTSGADVIRGTSGYDGIRGLGGNDVICGAGGNDRLIGDAGHDKLYGNGGDDSFMGEAGQDRLYGHAGDDKLYGHAGKDKLYGQAGKDYLRGADGIDELYGGPAKDHLAGDDGNDFLNGGSPGPGPNGDTCLGGAGTDAGVLCEPFVQ